MNNANFIGRLTRDAISKTFDSGNTVYNFSVAVNRTYRDASGEFKAVFIDVQAWNALGEKAAPYLTKGRKVGISGTIDSMEYTDRETGKTHNKLIIVANRIDFCEKREDAPTEPKEDKGEEKTPPTPAPKGLTPADDEDDFPF